MRLAAMYHAEFIAIVICAPRFHIKKRHRVWLFNSEISRNGHPVTLHNGIKDIPNARPKCTRCGADIWLEYVEPMNTGYKNRKFKCSSCDGPSIVQFS